MVYQRIYKSSQNPWTPQIQPKSSLLQSRAFELPVEDSEFIDPGMDALDMETESKPGKELEFNILANIPISAPTPPPVEPNQPPLQMKGLTIGEPGDKYEQEADRVARKVVSEINSSSPELQQPPALSRKSMIQRKKPEKASEELTTEQNIFFQQEEYKPASQQVQELLAHNLTHLVQKEQANNLSDTNYQNNCTLSKMTFEGTPLSDDLKVEKNQIPNEMIARLKPSISLRKSSNPSILMRQTSPTSAVVTGRKARAIAGERGMAFAGYSIEEGWAFLTGPGGYSTGHRWNAPGFDGVAFKETGKFEIHILDNKSLARQENVSSATALTKNLLKNLDDLIKTVSQASFNNVPRIKKVRSFLQLTRSAIANNKPIPKTVKLVVTNFGGRSTGVTSRLARQGITFRNLMDSSSKTKPYDSIRESQSKNNPTDTNVFSQGNKQEYRRGKSRTNATVGVPNLKPPTVGIPSVRGQGKVAGLDLVFQGIHILLNWVNDKKQLQRVHQALEQQETETTKIRSQSPSMGVLLIIFYSGNVFSHIEKGIGRTRDEAEEQWRNLDKILSSDSKQSQQIWIPPFQTASIGFIRSPFPSVAIGTFAEGKNVLQNVEWGGVTGFDDEGQTTLSSQANNKPQFLILKVPEKIVWFNGSMPMTTSLSVQYRAAAEGGNIPVVNLDPIMPFSNVEAACVFPADDATDALFKTASPTRDHLNQLGRFVNFGKVRWIRPENIKIIYSCTL